MEHYKNLSLDDIPGEVWKPIQGWEGMYEISNKGRVKSLSRKMYGKDSPRNRLTLLKIHKPYLGKRKGSYLRAKLNINNKYFKFSVHRLVAQHFIPNPENLPIVNHLDGNRLNNEDKNLEFTTISGNNRHAIKLGLSNPTKNLPKSVVGVLHGRARFSEEEIYIIRGRYDSGEKPMSIWKDYQMVGYSGVVSICVRKNWKHLPERI